MVRQVAASAMAKIWSTLRFMNYSISIVSIGRRVEYEPDVCVCVRESETVSDYLSGLFRLRAGTCTIFPMHSTVSVAAFTLEYHT